MDYGNLVIYFIGGNFAYIKNMCKNNNESRAIYLNHLQSLMINYFCDVCDIEPNVEIN